MTAKDADEAVANANRYTSYDVGYCLKFVRSPCWEVGSFYASAIDAWNGAKHKHPGDRNPPKGAPCFYRGGNYGHIVISVGGGQVQMRSTDCQSSGHVSTTDLGWPERAWGDTYLGWASDLNGVDLPLGDDTDNGNEDDDMPDYDHASTGKAQKVKANEWVAIVWEDVPAGDAFVEGAKGAKLGGATYSAVLHAVFDAPEGSTIRLRCVEVSDGNTDESNPQTEVLATGGSTYAEQSQIGAVGKGRTLAWRVSCTQDATLTSADVVTLSW